TQLRGPPLSSLPADTPVNVLVLTQTGTGTRTTTTTVGNTTTTSTTNFPIFTSSLLGPSLLPPGVNVSGFSPAKVQLTPGSPKVGTLVNNAITFNANFIGLSGN